MKKEKFRYAKWEGDDAELMRDLEASGLARCVGKRRGLDVYELAPIWHEWFLLLNSETAEGQAARDILRSNIEKSRAERSN
jgi:hypothetical protein